MSTAAAIQRSTLVRDAGVDQCDEGNNQSHRKRMSDSDGRQGVPNR